jgi:hypothetical protein
MQLLDGNVLERWMQVFSIEGVWRFNDSEPGFALEIGASPLGF